jgi:branched-chain amino acid transport system permease protein
MSQAETPPGSKLAGLPPGRSLRVAGSKIAYREAGCGAPLLLVHGNAGSSRWFTPQLLEPPLGFHVIAPDLPNYGASDPLPAEVTIDAYARQLLRFVEELGVADAPGGLVLLGHSLGGGVVQAMAAARPGLLRGLVLLASAPPGGFVTPEEHYPYLMTIPGNEPLLRAALQPTVGQVSPELFEALLHDALQMRGHAFTDGGRALAQLDLRAAAARSDFPVLVVRGDNDLIISEEQARATHRAFPDAQLELWAGVGHSPQLEVPDRFNMLLSQFLEGLP